ncbi:putative membrane protein [Bacteroides fragilis str. 3986 N(B)19]|nr:putative membrane protein [Bacteroides fragilis str. 3986 N(B)19]
MIPGFKSYTNEKALLVVQGLILVEPLPLECLFVWYLHVSSR